MYSNQFVLELIKDAINDELSDNKFYADLAKAVKDIDDKKTLEQMSLDEKKHYEMFADIYKKLSDKEYSPENVEYKTLDTNIINNIERAINGEFAGVEAYRPILFALENKQFKNYLTEIITDEQNHAAKLIYMVSKNR